MKTILQLQLYMGKRKVFLPIALLLSAISAILSVLPYVLIWMIIRIVLDSEGTNAIQETTTLSWWTVIAAIGSVLTYFLALTLSHLSAFRVENNIRLFSMQKIIAMPLGFFDSQTSGKIRKVIDENASTTHSFLAHQLPDLAATIVMPIASIVLMFAFDWKMGLVCLIPIIGSMIILSSMMNEKGKAFMKSYMDSLEEMNTEAVEYVRGIPVVKVFQQTVFSFKNFHTSIIKYRNKVIKYTKLWEIPMSFYMTIIHSFVFFLIPLGIIILNNSNSYATTIINLIFYILISPLFGQCIMRSMYLQQALGQASEAVNRINEITSAELLSVTNQPKTVNTFNISFKNVSFSYPGSAKKVIKNVSFEIPEGKAFALVGPSGSGKTTIARLLPRFWDIKEGEITIGGTNIKELAPSYLMENISFVFQHNKLFKTTILDNLRYGNPNASREEINRALQLAQCNDIIEKLPEGLKTMIGTNGTYLSGGEQQRIALARAILKDAPIIVMDEATAFADPENEHLIQKALKELTKGKTVLMIAHRLSSIKDVDQILVIKDGQIAEKGTHNNLIIKKGIYESMWAEYQQSSSWTIRKEAQYV